MNVAVLGSSGQIGAYLTDYLRKKGHFVREFDIVNSYHEDMTHIPNPFLRNVIMDSDFVFFLAFDVGGSHYLKKYQHTFKFIDNNTRMMANVFVHLADYKKPFVFASSQMSNMSYSPYGVMKTLLKYGEMACRPDHSSTLTNVSKPPEGSWNRTAPNPSTSDQKRWLQ